VRYAARLPTRNRLAVSYAADSGGGRGLQQPKDPWHNWVFVLSANGNFSGEASAMSSYINGQVSASRVTEDWKLRVAVSGNRDHGTYKLDDTTTIVSHSSSYFATGLVARSMGEHWTSGVQSSARSSTVDNEDLILQVGPAVEYDFFKYSESTRRLLTLQYGISVVRARYGDTTVYDKLGESLMTQRLTLALSAQQPRGSENVGVTGTTYLHDLSKNRAEIFGGASVRLVKGLSVNFFGNYSRVRDQLSLAKGNVSEEELLLRLRQLKTNYRYFIFTRLSYTFGSIFNNIVNPRFGGSGGGGFFFSFQ